MFDGMFGNKPSGDKQQNRAGNTAAAVGAQAAPLGQAYDRGAAASFGANAGDYMRNAQQSASQLADEQARGAATSGTRAATQAARTSGLNKGQAALAGSQRAGDIYGNTQQAAMNTGIGNYMAGTQQIAGQGAEMAGRRLNAAGIQAGIGSQQAQQGAAQQQAMWGAVGNTAGAAASMLSDERAKDVKGPLDLEAALGKLRTVSYDYKGRPGEGRIGVLAQDVEKGPMKEAVVDTPAGKALDARELAPATLALVAKLYRRVQELEKGRG
jgi:hypothetical protein